MDNEKVDNKPVDLSEEKNKEEIELPPPEKEKNEATVLNIGNIFAFIFILFGIILIIITIAGTFTKKKKIENTELDKTGYKTSTDLFDKNRPAENINPFPPEVENNIIPNAPQETIEEQIPAFTNPPANVQPYAPAPTPAGKSSAYKSDRPDTRTSKSPRKIEGIKGSDYSNISIETPVSNMISGRKQLTQTAPNMSTSENRANFISDFTSQLQKTSQQSNNYQSDKENFFNQQANNSGTGEFMAFNSIWDGTIISGALITAINTDNPGIVIARVTENVFSSYDGSLLLIPEGSLMYATYNSSVSYGQQRIQVAWNLLIRPDGYRIQLGNMNGVDAMGASGYAGKVTNHPFETLKALGLVAVFSIIQTEMTNDINAANNEYIKNSMSDVYSESSKLGGKILDKALDIKPTIKIKQGTEIKFITNAPLEFPPVEINEVTQKYNRTK